MCSIVYTLTGASQTEDGPLAPDLQLDWLSSTESDDDSGIEVLSVQYNSANNSSSSSSTNTNNIVSLAIIDFDDTYINFYYFICQEYV